MTITGKYLVPLLAVLAFYLSYRQSPNPVLQHPIDTLIWNAERRFEELLSSETRNCQDAIIAYKSRRGRSPPPGFTRWIRLAHQYKALVIEELWDPIYEDLAMFWDLSPDFIQSQLQQLSEKAPKIDINLFTVNAGNVTHDCEDDQFCADFHDLFRQAGELGIDILPALDIPVNRLITPRIFVPWHMPGQLVSKDNTQELLARTREESGRPSLQAMIRESCDPDSLLQRGNTSTGDRNIHEDLNRSRQRGFVTDFTLSKSVCEQPQLLDIHGSFIAPQYPELATQDIVPMFSVQKIAGVNHEIRVPSTLYWSEPKTYFLPDNGPWSSKVDKLFWRGGNSGGRVDRLNWKHFHRHLLVAGMNSTTIRSQPDGPCQAPALHPGICEMSLRERNALADFAQETVDVGFYAFGCVDKNHTNGSESGCDYLDESFEPLNPIGLGDVQRHKYLLDVDGNGYSARFRSFLYSNSVPIKATIYDEWHDSRLVPWKHLVPLDNSFLGIWGILDYFIGGCVFSGNSETTSRDCEGHDQQAKHIALSGAAWARKVLRKEDMLLYVLRLLMEYGRIIRNDRDTYNEQDICEV